MVNPTSIYYPYYHDGICFQNAEELRAHLEKGAASDKGPNKNRKRGAAGADASNAKELADGLAGVDADGQTDTEGE